SKMLSHYIGFLKKPTLERAPPGGHPHTAHRHGANPTAVPDRASRRPHRPPAAWRQGSALPVGSAGAPRVDTFSSGTRSSSISVCLRDKRWPQREEALSPVLCPTATIDDSTGAFSDRLLGPIFQYETFCSLLSRPSEQPPALSGIPML